MSALLLLKVVTLALSLASMWLLFKEVWLAHDGEEVGTGLAQLQRIEAPMARGDWVAAYAETLCFRRPEKYSLPEARAFIQRGQLTPAACQLALVQEFGSLAAFHGLIDDRHGDFIRRAAPAALHRRRRWLLLGAALGALALLLQGRVTWAEWAEVPRQQTQKDANGAGGEGAETSNRVSRPVLRLVGKPILFDTAEWATKDKVEGHAVDLSGDLCAAKRGLLARQAGGVFVVGRHDRRTLRGPLAAEIYSNEALALQRAETVAKFLSEPNDCGRAVGPVVRVNAAPLILGRGPVTAEALAADRSVEVYGLVAE